MSLPPPPPLVLMLLPPNSLKLDNSDRSRMVIVPRNTMFSFWMQNINISVSKTLVQFKWDLFIIIGTNSCYLLSSVIGRYSQSQPISSELRQA